MINQTCIYVLFMDSLGNDYLVSNHIKPNEVRVKFFNNNIYAEQNVPPAYLEKQQYYIFRLLTFATSDFRVEIGNKITDTVNMTFTASTWYDVNRESYKDPFFGDTLINFMLIKSAWYNNRRLLPPQFNADGSVHVHKIVVKED